MKATTVIIALPTATKDLLAKAPTWPRALTLHLVRALDRENELTVGHIVRERATGKGPFPVSEGKLGVRTSRYRRSIRRTKAEASGTSISSAIGSNVRYAGAHEFGFEGVVNVRAHRSQNRALDVYQVRGRQVRGWELAGAGGRGKRVALGFTTVRAHQMRMRIPARAPIRRGIEDRVAHYSQALGAAVASAFEKGTA